MRMSGSRPLRQALAMLVLIAAPALPGYAGAELYRCHAAHGEGAVIMNAVRGLDVRGRQCEPINVRQSSLDRPMQKAMLPVGRSPSNSDGLAGMPGVPTFLVPAEVQRERDKLRRSVLEEELAYEAHAIAEVKQQFLAIPMDTEQSQRLEAKVARHRANIEALKREISRIR